MIAELIAGLGGTEERRAVCASVGKKMIDQGEMMVDKQPGMACTLLWAADVVRAILARLPSVAALNTMRYSVVISYHP